jgi:hypothetical protein
MDNIIKSGRVKKLHPKGLQKVWKRVLLKLTPDGLGYYTLPYQNLIETIPLELVSQVEVVDDVLIVRIGQEEPRFQHFRIDEPFELNHWFTTINDMLPVNPEL